MKQNYNIDGVDMVTFPGADFFLMGTTQKKLHLSEGQSPY
jgi:hypothetical protein